MKIAATIARLLLGVMFVVFGANGFLHFIPQPPPPSEFARQYFTVLSQSHYLIPVFIIQFVAGTLFLANRFVPLALTILAPVLVNIFIYHITMDLPGIIPGIVATILWTLVFTRHRQAFAPILRAKPTAA